MEKLRIEEYRSAVDKPIVIALLKKEEMYLNIFLEMIENYNDEDRRGTIFLAVFAGKIAGVLLMNVLGSGRAVETVIFIKEEYRNKRIGTSLLQLSDLFNEKDLNINRSYFGWKEGTGEPGGFLLKNGYSKYTTIIEMERGNEILETGDIEVRQYRDSDYEAWDDLSEMAYYKMRERAGVFPPYFYMSNEREKQEFLETKNDRYVMLENGEIIGVGYIKGNELNQVVIRNDKQSLGYGRKFTSLLINEIISRGNDSVTLSVNEGNFALELFESLGFKEKKKLVYFQKFFPHDAHFKKPLKLVI